MGTVFEFHKKNTREKVKNFINFFEKGFPRDLEG